MLKHLNRWLRHTIKHITKILTTRHTRDANPNCIEGWNRALNFPIDVDTMMLVFNSFGTPLSDPTEERQWRKLQEWHTRLPHSSAQEEEEEGHDGPGGREGEAALPDSALRRRHPWGVGLDA